MKSLLVALLALIATFSPAVAQEPKVYALVVGDATPAAKWGKLLPNITLDLLSMNMMLWENLPKSQLERISVTLEEDEDATPAAILEALAELKPTARDTLLVYFTGHGAVDDHGHYFSLAGGKLYREEIKRQMMQKQAHLTVLISDCCNVRSDGRAYLAPAPQINERRAVTPLFQSLLLKPKGVVDINGSSPGQSAFFTPETPARGQLPGSLFTKALAEYVRKNRKRPSTWEELLLEVGNNVHLAFRTGYPKGASVAKGAVIQRDQTVYAIEYPDMPKSEGPRTGVKVRDQQGRGAWIFAVDAGSPATRVFDISNKKYTSLQPGQMIVAAHGHRVTSAADFAAIVKDSPQILRFALAEAQGQREYLMRLRY